MGLFRDAFGRSEPDEPVVGYEEWRPAVRSRTLAAGTLACNKCDAPVALVGLAVSPSDLIGCPFCLHEARVREFLTLGEPTRPTHVTVRIEMPPALAPRV